MNVKAPFESNLNFSAIRQERVYGFIYENFENDILKSQIFYELEVHFMTGGYDNNYVCEVNRKQIIINNKKPGSKIEKITETAAQTIFPLKIKIKKNGEIDKILNHEAIKNRWLEANSTIIDYYKGEKIPKVILRIETLLLNEISLKDSLGHNWFFHLFFTPLYGNYSKIFCNKHIWKSPVFGNQFIEYSVVKTVVENFCDDGKIHINVDGVSIDERTISELISGYSFPMSKLDGSEFEPVASKMNVDYKLYEEDHSIFSVLGTFETKIDNNTTQKIQVEIYHLTDTSSYRPQSDSMEKENQKIDESDQAVDKQKGKDNYFFDLSKEIRENSSIPLDKPIYTGEKIELFVEEVFPKKKRTLWSIITSIFKRKNKSN